MAGANVLAVNVEGADGKSLRDYDGSTEKQAGLCASGAGLL